MESMSTVQNFWGDVANYIVQDEKHTMFIFNARTTTSELSTVTELEDGSYAFLYYSEGVTMSEVWPEGMGTYILKQWGDLLNHLDIACNRK